MKKKSMNKGIPSLRTAPVLKQSEETSFAVENSSLFKQKAIYWADKFDTFCILDNNFDNKYKYSSFEYTLAVDAVSFLETSNFDSLESYRINKDIFGYFSYDLKNEIEQLSSENKDMLKMPLLYFFEPRYLLQIKDGKVSINRNYPEAFHIFDQINSVELPRAIQKQNILLNCNVSKAEYIKNVEKIKNHIEEGDVYELNYCIEYNKIDVDLEVLSTFNRINIKTKSPFSSALKFKNWYTLSFSPERFLRKEKNKLVSQPIKGTIKTGTTAAENNALQKQLQKDIKERAENVMIVDLVRNDLTKSAKTGSIKVEELFAIYGFETINQMISTIVAESKDKLSNTSIIKNTFPMGSMTGAPKIRAMQLIEKFEQQKRGIYSGAIGYMNSENDFDFNVVIRTLVYDRSKKYLSLQVGGAITYDSIAEKEWQETKEKVKAIIEEL